MPESRPETAHEVEPNRLYILCDVLTQTAAHLHFQETPQMIQIGLSIERDVAEKGPAELLTRWRELAAGRIEAIYPKGTPYDVVGLKQNYFAVELLYIANLIRWGMLVHAKESAEQLLSVAYADQDVRGVDDVLEEILDELETDKNI